LTETGQAAPVLATDRIGKDPIGRLLLSFSIPEFLVIFSPKFAED